MGCPTGNYCFVFVFALVLRVMRASEEERREKYRESRKQSWSVSNKKMVAEAQRCANVMFMTSRVACCVTVLRSVRVPLDISIATLGSGGHESGYHQCISRDAIPFYGLVPIREHALSDRHRGK